MTRDEGIRPDSTIEKLATLKPAFKEDGVITAANSSQITDGAAAVLIMSEEKANALGLKPRARFHTFALAGVDPVMMLTGPIPATTKVLERAKMTIDQMDLIEINEAFAPVVLVVGEGAPPRHGKVNVNGGAIALGHPLGCSGARLMTTLLNELERTGGRYGLQTMCEGGGMANATIIESGCSSRLRPSAARRRSLDAHGPRSVVRLQGRHRGRGGRVIYLFAAKTIAQLLEERPAARPERGRARRRRLPLPLHRLRRARSCCTRRPKARCPRRRATAASPWSWSRPSSECGPSPAISTDCGQICGESHRCDSDTRMTGARSGQ